MADAAAAVPMNPNDATMAKAIEIAHTSGRDEFTVRVTHRAPGTIQEELLVSFLDATSDQIAHPEAWLPSIGGGGQYRMRAYHVNDRAQVIGADITLAITGQRVSLTPNQIFEIVSRPDWQGPKTIEYPKRIGNGRPGGSSDDPLIRMGGLAQPASLSVLAGSDASQPSRTPAGTTSSDALMAALNAERERMRLLEQRLHEREQEMREERHRNEIANANKEAKLELERLRAEIAGNTAKKDDGVGGLAQILLEMNKDRAAADERRLAEQRAADERREADLRRADERREAEAKRAEERAAADRKSAEERNNLLLGKLLERPQTDPAAAATTKIVADMASGMSSVMQMALGFVHSMRELQAPADDEPGWLKGINAVLQGLAAMQGGGMAGLAGMASAGAQGGPAAGGPAGGPMIPPQQMAAPQVQQAPAPTPAPQQPQPQPRMAFNDAPIDTTTPYGAIVKAIMAKHEPTALATYFLDHVEDPSIQQALQASGGNIIAAFRPPLQRWLAADPKNQAYAVELLAKIEAVYKQRQAAAAQQSGGEEEGEEEEEEGDESAEEGAEDPVGLE